MILIGVLTLSCATLTACNAEERSYTVPRESKFVEVNGIALHYEVCGSGQPFILLHGNGENLSIFDGLVDKLAADYTVYAIDTRGHGQSGEVNEYHYVDMMNDVFEFISLLRLDSPLLYGFSDGGIVGLMLAAKYPNLLDKLMVSGANLTPDGIKGYFILGCKIGSAFTKGAKKSLFDLMINEPNITDADLNNIIAPTLVLAGSRDIVKEEETKRIANGISGSTLNIIKGESHGSYVKDGVKIYKLLTDYLNGFEN